MNFVNPTTSNVELYYKEFGTSKEQVARDVIILKEWFYDQPHLPHQCIKEDSVFEKILLRSKFSMERSKQTLDLHFTLKSALPELYSNRDPMGEDILTFNKLVNSVMLPGITTEGYRVYFQNYQNKDATGFRSDINWKWTLMVLDNAFFNLEEHNMGFVIIHDLTNISMGYLTKLSLPLIKKMELCVKKGYSMRIKGIHFINPPPFMGTLMSMLKATLKSKMAARIHVHESLESLYEHVDRHVLPVDYGGDAKKLSEIAGLWRREMESRRSWFLDHEVTGRVDESRRPGKAVDTDQLFGIEGSFKKLNVD